MSRIDNVFNRLRNENKKVLIPYVSCGYPSIDISEKLILKLAVCGADIIELGVPFSDPVADGPSIQKASSCALANGINMDKIIALAARVREKTDIPLIIMSYYNPILVRGVKRFLVEAKEVGIDGLIIPDLPIEEAGFLLEEARKKDIKIIFLVSPNTPSDRIELIMQKAQGFVYCVSVLGITGSREKINSEIKDFIQRLRSRTDLPLAVGFGISNPEMARAISRQADGVIVGSALLDKMEKYLKEDKVNYCACVNIVAKFVIALKKAISEK